MGFLPRGASRSECDLRMPPRGLAGSGKSAGKRGNGRPRSLQGREPRIAEPQDRTSCRSRLGFLPSKPPWVRVGRGVCPRKGPFARYFRAEEHSGATGKLCSEASSWGFASSLRPSLRSVGSSPSTSPTEFCARPRSTTRCRMAPTGLRSWGFMRPRVAAMATPTTPCNSA